MLKSTVKKRLIQLKEQHEDQLIKTRLIENRLINILEMNKISKQGNRLPKKAKKELGFKIYAEIHRLHNLNLISEQSTISGIFDFLKKELGNIGMGAFEGVIVEPLVNSILSKLGLGGYFKNFLVSFFSTNPQKVIQSFKDCGSMVKLISESLVEATFMMLQDKKDLGSVGYDVLRNAIGKAVKNTQFSKEIEEQISDVICDIFDDITASTKGSLEQFT